MKRIIFLICTSLLFTYSTCKQEDENHHRTIEIINNSEIDIYAYFQSTYPDTLGNVGGVDSQPQIYKVEAHTKNRSALWQREFWEVVFRDGRLIPSDTLMVFIMDAVLLESHTTNVLNTIIRRYDLSLADLQRLNWTLTYPPSEAMKDMKMYPPYER